jgi:two-component system sensor histidine kinase UhpB
MMEMYPGIDRTPLFDVLRRCMDERTAHFMENEFTYPDGDTGWFALSIQPVPEGLLIFSWDITERKRDQQALEESNKRIRRLAVQRAEVETTERRRLARELHDHVGQNLTALGINLNILLAQLPEDQEMAQARLRDSLALIEETIEQTRDVMVNLRPPVLEDYGLAAALRWYAEQFTARTQLPVTVTGEQLTPRLAPHLQDALFRIAQEAMNNAAKYARAAALTISIEATPDMARLAVADDGEGFDAAAVLAKGITGHWGLQTMQERAELVGGTLRIESAPGQGTRVIAEVPR